MRVTFPYSPAEHAEALYQSVSGRVLRWLMRLSGVVTAASGLFLLVVMGNELLRDALLLIALGAFFSLGGPPITQALARLQFRRESQQENRRLETVTVGLEGITPGTRWSHPIHWSHVKRVFETDNLIVIDASSDGPTFIPKHALSADDRAKLEALLRERFQDRPKDLRLKALEASEQAGQEK